MTETGPRTAAPPLITSQGNSKAWTKQKDAAKKQFKAFADWEHSDLASGTTIDTVDHDAATGRSLYESFLTWIAKVATIPAGKRNAGNPYAIDTAIASLQIVLCMLHAKHGTASRRAEKFFECLTSRETDSALWLRGLKRQATRSDFD